MAMSDMPDLFEDEPDMQRRYQTVYEFLVCSGSTCDLSRQFLIQVLGHLCEALRSRTTDSSLWNAFVMLDVLIDRWDECVANYIREENENDIVA